MVVVILYIHVHTTHWDDLYSIGKSMKLKKQGSGPQLTLLIDLLP